MDQGSRGLSYAPVKRYANPSYVFMMRGRHSEAGDLGALRRRQSARIVHALRPLRSARRGPGHWTPSNSFQFLKEPQRRSPHPRIFFASTLPQAVSASGASSEKGPSKHSEDRSLQFVQWAQGAMLSHVVSVQFDSRDECAAGHAAAHQLLLSTFACSSSDKLLNVQKEKQPRKDGMLPPRLEQASGHLAAEERHLNHHRGSKSFPTAVDEGPY